MLINLSALNGSAGYAFVCLMLWLLVFALAFGAEFIADNWASKPDVEQTQVSELATVVVKVARVRSGPGTEYGVIGGVREGEKVQVLSESNDWSHIRGGSLVGYVYSSLLEFKPMKADK
ncbi:MAG: SH3 domain-containing protein, partial [bacterium]